VVATQGAAFASSPDEGVERRAALVSRRKRALDLVAAGALVTLTAPVWAVIGCAIKLTSRGPVLFRQERIGVGGRPFTLYKFRTMRNGVSEHVHRQFVTEMITSGVTSLSASQVNGTFKLSRDDRITRIGRILRKTSLDELPQLINVLNGDMSLVGPRPPLEYEVARYEAWQHERLAVRPGITGLWQVSGRNRLSYNEMCELDLAYIRRWSIGRDLAIIARTPWAMFVDRGGAA
jgi:lipopolysaccharide/colanic/teichoic acid biosynthesis glycosyltransferase